MLTASQAAAFLGVSRSKMYDLAARGRLPCYRIDSALRFEGHRSAQSTKRYAHLAVDQLQAAVFGIGRKVA